jgi:hypothetical protein
MIKKSFISLMIGFGATLAIFVAVTMPPGSWAVIVGVILGMLAIIPVLLVILMFISRQPAHRTVEQPQSRPQIIVMQPPVQQAYTLPQTPYQPQYLPHYEQQGYVTTQATRSRQKPLPSRRRVQYEDPRYAQNYEQDYYYETLPADPSQYDTYYYGEEAWGDYQHYPPRPTKKQRRKNDSGVVDGEYRTLGEY